MFSQAVIRKALVLLIILTTSLSFSAFAQKKKKTAKPPKPVVTGTPVIWRDPGDISARDLRYGPGSEAQAPVAPFTFVKEDSVGASPKVEVSDARGARWIVKLGEEAQAETVATRLVWAMGYFAEEAYYLDRVEVKNLPRLKRAAGFTQGSTLLGARFEPRNPQVTRGATWDWLQNPFVGTRELDGLKVLMVLLANYDTRLLNNRILYEKNPQSGQMEARYVVTDIGATLGHVGGLGGKRSKNNLEHFSSSKFIIGVENGMVEFDYDTTPKGGAGAFASIFNPGYSKRQANKEKAMRRIPVQNARWIGSQLARLSDDQLRDAFRAAGYDKTTMDGFIKALRHRIEELNRLS
ncbi:MAG TPA: hypothetical protein VF708_08205 [Pyrinomonadaceae bacterium]|jgi:hypothetical protein